ncbi:hypothetical protein SLEP1_g42265 [Rubroshorea leprosula]|uniref:RRM domain-containing protein n=1 Tax=Rubroshorea leprosula TaxID=152421 RepID=A0AAV5L984_9ROSI|nr:hypothetical protein SLEP1_g42265 [Rubroshorea leprosula]
MSTRGTARGAVAGNDGGFRQRQGHRNRVAGYGSQFFGWSKTFFFYNFSEELETKFLWNCFQMYGKVVDVYVPNKGDKRGKRFGFVRMAGVKNELQMERQLDTMWIGSYKMKVKIADDRQRKPAQSRKLQGASAPEETSRMAWLRISRVPLKAWGERCFQRIESRRIATRIILKVGDQQYEIEIAEEEWRSDLDWWLTENDWNNDQKTESDDSSVAWSQNEDLEMGVDVIGDGDDVSSDSVHLMKDMDLNSNLKIATGMESRNESETEREFEGDERQGWAKEHGLHRIISFNVRGLGGMVKRKEVGKLVREERPDFLFLQETKLERIDVGMCKILWNSDEFEWVAKASSGASGGLLCLWDRRYFVKREEFTGDGYVGVSREWGENKQQCSLINVYGPNDRQKRAKLWEELRKRMIDKEGWWLIVGDFNVVRGPEERRGKTGVSFDMRDFEEFIVSTGLVDVKLMNRRYTWYKPDGTAMSRLDRFLLSTQMNNMGGEWIQWGLPRNIFYHCAMVLKSKSTNWGPRPFRVLDSWQQHPGFKKAVEDKWREMAVEGFVGYKCKQKLKLLKEFLKGWNKEVFGNMEAQYVQVVKKIEQVDMQNEVADLEELEIVKRQEGFFEMWDVLRKRELIWRQKSRSRWIREGDANTRFFHKVANGRRAQNNIAGLMCDGVWIEDLEAVKNEVVKYFRSLFQGDPWNRPKPEGIKFQKISEEKKEWLERPFSVEEIEEGLRSCDGSKAPGLDGYNFNFLKFTWHCIKEDFISFFLEFHQNAVAEGMLHGIEIGKKGMTVSLLQFADDTIIMGRVDAENIRMVKGVLRWFELMSGLRINFNKSSIYGYNVSEGWLKGSAGMLRCGVGRAPFLYLGLPIGSKSGSKKMWEPMVNKFRAKLAVWKATTLSFGGRLTLLKLVLSALPIFYMSLLLLPKFVRAELISIQRRFIWGGPDLNKKILWVKWEYVCRDKVKGGLGVLDLLRKNWALLGKWWYRLGDGVENLWKRVVREKYYGGRSEVDITAVEGSRVSKLWRDIIRMGGQSPRIRNMLVEGFKWEVGEGNKVDFWHERWVGDKTLRDLCPRLYAVSVKKEGKVSEMGSWNEDGWCWRVEWRRGTIGREKDEEVVMEKVLEGVQVKEGVGDVWKWRLVMDGRYVVKIAYKYLDYMVGELEDQMCKLIWCRLVPSKVAFFGWRLCFNRLPTKENLQKCGV